MYLKNTRLERLDQLRRINDIQQYLLRGTLVYNLDP